jgi:hypothetical protein
MVVLMHLKRVGGRKPRLIATVRCPGGCAMKLRALGVSRKHKRARAVPIWRRSISHTARQRVFRIRVSPGWRVVRVDARAQDRSGRVKVHSGTVRLPRAR